MNLFTNNLRQSSELIVFNIFYFRRKLFFIATALLFVSAFFITATQAAWQAATEIVGNTVSTGVWESAILAPVEGQSVSGDLDLIALYADENSDGDDQVLWAVRAGTCAAGVGTEFGNVDGFNDSFVWNGQDFTATIDTTTVSDGLYCFVFNPTEDAGNTNQRLTRNFIINNVPDPIVCDPSSSFDDFTLASVNGQAGWSATGPYDQEIVVNTFGVSGFGCQSLRVSNAVTSGSFGDWIFTPSVVNEVGESSAINSGFSGGVRQNHFSAEFDIAAATTTYQPNLQLSVSPDRGDGARMSYLRFSDQADGIHVYFNDYTGGDFNETDIATLSRLVTHSIRFEMQFVDGAENDVVEIYIDNVLTFTGTSWEEYFRAVQPDIAPPTVDSLLIQARNNQGGDVPANLGGGFLFDNFSLNSSNTVPPAPVVLGPGDVVLNEIYPNPLSTTTVPLEREWVELYNNTSDPVDVLGWKISEISGTSTENIYSIVSSGATASQMQPIGTTDTVIAPGGLLILQFGGASSRLNNGGDTVTLYTDLDTLLDTHIYPATVAGKSHQRIPDGGIWVDPEPTPGQVNRVSRQDLIDAGLDDEQIETIVSLLAARGEYLIGEEILFGFSETAAETLATILGDKATSTADVNDETASTTDESDNTGGGGGGGGAGVTPEIEVIVNDNDAASTTAESDTTSGGGGGGNASDIANNSEVVDTTEDEVTTETESDIVAEVEEDVTEADSEVSLEEEIDTEVLSESEEFSETEIGTEEEETESEVVESESTSSLDDEVETESEVQEEVVEEIEEVVETSADEPLE